MIKGNLLNSISNFLFFKMQFISQRIKLHLYHLRIYEVSSKKNEIKAEFTKVEMNYE